MAGSSLDVVWKRRMLSVSGKPSSAGRYLLESGESLHSFEFLERYQRMPQVMKAELDVRGQRRVGCPDETASANTWSGQGARGGSGPLTQGQARGP